MASYVNSSYEVSSAPRVNLRKNDAGKAWSAKRPSRHRAAIEFGVQWPEMLETLIPTGAFGPRFFHFVHMT